MSRLYIYLGKRPMNKKKIWGTKHLFKMSFKDTFADGFYTWK